MSSGIRSFPATVYMIPSRRPEGAAHIVTVLVGSPSLTLCTCEAGQHGKVCWAQLEARDREKGPALEVVA